MFARYVTTQFACNAYSHSADHTDSKLKTNALNPTAGYQKKPKDDFIRKFLDKGFNNGASKAEQRAFYKQKPV